MSALADRWPGLARHWQVLREAWALENEASAARRQWSDQQFLPAALEIMETPASPGLRALLLGLCALFALALGWSIIGRIDVVAVATGKIIPSSNIKVIQPIEIGSVRAIHVADGQHVRRGDLLVELDPTLAGADHRQAGRELLAAELDTIRNQAVLGYLRSGRIRLALPADVPPAVAATQRRMVETMVAEYEGQRANLAQQRAEHAAELAGATVEIAKLRQTLPLVDQQLEVRRTLSERGYFSRMKMLEYQQLKIEHEHNIDVQQAIAAKARAAIASADAQLAALRATFGKTAVADLVKAENDTVVRSEEVTKTDRRRTFQQLVSPVDGTVQQLAIHTVGGVVQPAQALMVIVPDGSDVVVEAQVLNKDIGFVRVGQPVRVKLEAYPFTTYGVIDGTVAALSRDAVAMPAPDAPAKASERPEPGKGLVYLARIRLAQRTIRVGGRDEPLGPGLAVQAEIKTGRRRVISYLLSPLTRTFDEAGRER